LDIRGLIDETIEKIHENKTQKINLIWLEATGCSGDIISFLNTYEPDMLYFLKEMVNLRFCPSVMFAQGSSAFEEFLDTLETDFILGVEGAVSSISGGAYTIIASYNGKEISAAEAITLAAPKAKHIISIGTCAAFGGISAAKPNPSGCTSLETYLGKKTINVPGCPVNPLWLMGTIASLMLYNTVELDEKGRPLMFFKETNHTNCSRRSYFDKNVTAKKLGDPECMFKLGCRGPITKAYCPLGRWNSNHNWPVEANTPCIGCASEYFPDGTEPFVRY
jgi:hydrogenase small subunit